MTSPEGVVLGAVAGTLSAPLPVAVRKLASPAEPLPADATLVGDIHEVAAETELLAPEELPLPVGLPIPPGTDPATLGALVLVTRVAAGEPAPVREWVLTDGSYDAASNLFVVTLSELGPGGVALALTAAAPAPPASGFRSAAAELFQIRCDAPARIEPATCATATPVVSNALTSTYTPFVTDQGFKEPSLRRHRGFFEGLPPVPKLEREVGLCNVLITCLPVYTIIGGRRQEARAAYDPQTRSIRVGVDTIITDRELATSASSTRHELFHTVQYAYNWKLPFNGGRAEGLTSWFVEGTAKAAESSGAAMARNTGTIMRPVDVPMLDTEYDYGTQDFWVHAVLEQGGGLAYLQPMLEHGLTPNRIADRISFAALWWGWVKSQIMESKYPIYHDGLTACRVRDHDITFEFLPDDYPHLNERITLFEPAASLTWPTQQQFASAAGLPALTAQVVKVTFSQAASHVLIGVQRLGSTLPVTYKVYLDGESELVEGEPKCRRIADGCRNFSQGQPAADIPAGGIVYVVVANDAVDPDSPPFGYEVSIFPAEGLCSAAP